MKFLILKFNLFLIGFVFLTGCGEVRRSVFVDSFPQGAQILDSEKKPMRLTTPAYVEFSENIESHLIFISKPGYKEVSAYFNRDITTDFISIGEVFLSIGCAPFCCGLPLLKLLDPVDVTTRFVPDKTQVNLEQTGGGVHLRVFPPTTEVFVDGVSRGQVLSDEEVFIKMNEGERQLEFRADGFEKNVVVKKVLIEKEKEVRLNVRLKAVESGIYIKKSPAKILKHVQIFQSKLPSEKLKSEPLYKLTAKDFKEIPIVDREVDENEWFLQKIPEGIYFLKVEGKTSNQKNLTYSTAITISPSHLTVFDLVKSHFWKLRPWLGISYQYENLIKKGDRIGDFVLSFSKKYPQVNRVVVGSPAYRAGFQVNDMILAVNGISCGVKSSRVRKSIASSTQLISQSLGGLGPNDPVLFDVQRDGGKIVHLKINALGSQR